VRTLTPVSPATPTPPLADAEPANHPMRVLLAEDNPVNQRVAQLMLAKLGHTVDTVANGREAVEALTRGSYDAVLMDVQMPVMDGLEATRRIRAELPADHQPHIIAMTASALAEDEQETTAAGMDDFLAKPVRARELSAMLRHAHETSTRPTSQHPHHTHQLERMIEPEPSVRLGSNASMPVDLYVLDRLRTQLDDVDGSEFSALINTYMLDGAGWVTDLATAVAAGDWPRISAVARSWAASSELMGAAALARLLREMESAAESTTNGIGPVAAAVQTEHARVANSLRLLNESTDVGRTSTG
jgi:CheY-like chemotaxis protein